MNYFTQPLCNRTLFRRDDHRCLYCGGQFSRSELTRDHVVPISRGGSDKWENVVAACKRCNWLKDCQTPEEAHMPLLAVPFRPNTYEWHYLCQGAGPRGSDGVSLSAVQGRARLGQLALLLKLFYLKTRPPTWTAPLAVLIGHATLHVWITLLKVRAFYQ